MNDAFEEAAEDILAEMGSAGTYTAPGGAPVSCTLILEHDVETVPPSIDAQTWDRSTTIEVLLSEIGAEPEKGGVFETGGAAYTVVRIIGNDGQFATAVVKR